MADSEASVEPETQGDMRVNEYGTIEPTVLTVDDWNTGWEKRQIGFHKEKINELLEKHLEQMLKSRENIRIFFPLCGKAIDMKWLADMGHTVTGVDGSEMALMEFFQEQGLEYTTEEVAGFDGKLYKAHGGKIRLYCGDFYNLNKSIEGEFDAVWDRGAFVAINLQDRTRFSKLVTSLMGKDCRYLLSILDYDQTRHAGPPHVSSYEEVKQYYGDLCCVEEIDAVDGLEERHADWGLESLTERVMLITLR